MRWLLLPSFALLCVACTAPTVESDGPPDAVPPGLQTLPDPTPVQEPRSGRGNPEAYEVFGEQYAVMASGAGYEETGNASWYGKKFHGRQTSSGEPYDMFALTAAHRSLPIPTFVRVTNLDNGMTTIVRVNDRGPFHEDRIIDLSYAAAVKLGFEHSGTARVRVEAIEQLRRFSLQAGAFAKLEAADALAGSLTELTGYPAFVVSNSDDGLYRVRIGPVVGEGALAEVQTAMREARYSEPMVFETCVSC